MKKKQLYRFPYTYRQLLILAAAVGTNSARDPVQEEAKCGELWILLKEGLYSFGKDYCKTAWGPHTQKWNQKKNFQKGTTHLYILRMLLLQKVGCILSNMSRPGAQFGRYASVWPCTLHTITKFDAFLAASQRVCANYKTTTRVYMYVHMYLVTLYTNKVHMIQAIVSYVHVLYNTVHTFLLSLCALYVHVHTIFQAHMQGS